MYEKQKWAMFWTALTALTLYIVKVVFAFKCKMLSDENVNSSQNSLRIYRILNWTFHVWIVFEFDELQCKTTLLLSEC